MVDGTAVLDDTAIKTISGDTLFYFASDITPLTQADMPWLPPAAGQRIEPSRLHVVVAADTLKVRGTLRNPGRDIRIFARQLTFESGAVIDVSGADPGIDSTGTERDYRPGELPEQKDQSPGSAGVAGNPGAPGLSAGNISIFAETIVGAAGAGISLTDAAPLTTAVEATRQLVASSGKEGWYLGDLSGQQIGNGDVTFAAVDYTEVSLTGITSLITRIDDLHADEGDVIVIATFPDLAMTAKWRARGTWGPINGIQLATGALTTPPFSATLTVHMRRTADETWQAQALVPVLENFQPTAHVPLPLPGSAVLPVPFSWDTLTNAVVRAVGVIGSQFEALAVRSPSAALTLRAVGGRGGRGQDGCAGIKGAQGAAGEETDGPPINIGWGLIPFPNSIGGPGQPGGRGGGAGISGAGGRGGTIALGFREGSGLTIAASAVGGQGGAPADPGAGGPGGDGGPGGSYVIMLPDPHSMPPIRAARAPGWTGLPGLSGAAGVAGGPGAAGAAGQVICNGAVLLQGPVTSFFDYTQLAPYARAPQLLITQHAACLAYLNARSEADYEHAATLFQWLARITGPVAQPDFAPPDWSREEVETARGVCGHARSMCARLLSALDFFGHPRNWVPTFTLKNDLERISELISVGTIVEQQYRLFTTQQNNEAAQMAALQAMRDKLYADLANTAEQEKQLDGTIAEADQTIVDLTARLQTQMTAIVDDKDVFSRQFHAKLAAVGCSFTDVLNILTAIAAVGSAAVDGIGAVAGAAQAVSLAEDAEKEIAAAGKVIKAITKTLSTIDDIRKNVEAIRGMFPMDPGARDVGMLVTDRDKFDQLISKYADDPTLPEAAVLKAAVDDYFGLIDARNQAILSYASLFIERARLVANHAQVASQIAGIDALMPAVQTPQLPAYLSFMRSAYAGVKIELVTRLYEAHRALAYWTLKDEPFAVNDLNVAVLATALSRLVEQIDEAKLRNGPVQPFSGVVVEIAAKDLPLAFRALPRSRKLVFSISPHHPEFLNQYQVLVTDVAIVLPGLAPKSGMLTISLEHAGTEVQVGTMQVNGARSEFIVPFVHQRRQVPYTIDYANPASRRGGRIGDDDFVGLSPFATWTLDFAFDGNDWLDLAGLKSVQLVFRGSYYGPAEHARGGDR